MLYFICPTCKQVLADKIIIYEKISDDICNQFKIKKISKKEADALKIELNNSLELDKICCKMRMMAYTRDINYIS